MRFFAFYLKNLTIGISLTVQWLRLCISKAGGTNSTPGQATKIPHTLRSSGAKTVNLKMFLKEGIKLFVHCYEKKKKTL